MIVGLYFFMTLMMMYRNFEEKLPFGDRMNRLSLEVVSLGKTITFYVLMTVSCNKIKREAKKTAKIVNKVINYNRVPHLRMQLDILSLQIHHSAPMTEIHFVIIHFTWSLMSTVKDNLLLLYL